MKTFSKLIIVLGSVFCCLESTGASIGFDADEARTFLGPTFRLGYTSALNNDTAFSIAGEAAPKNMRIGGTVGRILTPQQRIKISVEYLMQDITYTFFTGNTNQWVKQGALGAAYQYDFNYRFNPQFDLNAYASHAPSKSLSTMIQTINNPDGSISSYIVDRRIAGSNAAGIAPGITITPWQGSRLSALLNYDSVRYDRKYQPDDNAIGLGGTIGFNQVLTRHMGLDLGAEFRQPYNNYTANLTWSTLPDCGNWVVGLYGNYLIGKESLPDTWNLGLSANYLFNNQPLPAQRTHSMRDLKGEVPAPETSSNVVGWTANPAVYMPQVLAVPDQRITNLCDTLSPIVLLSPLPSFIGEAGVPPGNPGTITDRNEHVFNSPTHFSGSNLTYSFSGSITFSDPNPVPPEAVFVIDPQTGVLTLPANTTISDTQYSLTITATNGCTSTSGTFLVEIDNL